jgi:putative CGCGG family rSAM target protein
VTDTDLQTPNANGNVDTDADGEHPGSWSANLEEDRHADDAERVVEEALDAVRATRTGYHVNLVTHGAHGHPEEYLYEPLESMDRAAEIEYVERCGCGGHVTRVHVE